MWHRELATLDVSELERDGDAVAFDYTDPFGNAARGFAVFVKGQVRAYRNLCPHWAVPIDHDGQFFDPSGQELMCHMHGATFDPETGRCTFGPPEGSGLERFELEPVPGQPGVVKVLRRPGLQL